MSIVHQHLGGGVVESNLSSSDPPKRKRGRPKGSKTKKLPQTEVVPPTCVRCNSTDSEIVRERRKPHEYLGKTVDGRPYDRVRWYVRSCRNCGQLFGTITREYEGDFVEEVK